MTRHKQQGRQCNGSNSLSGRVPLLQQPSSNASRGVLRVQRVTELLARIVVLLPERVRL